jgi:hypothetical protein
MYYNCEFFQQDAETALNLIEDHTKAQHINELKVISSWHNI